MKQVFPDIRPRRLGTRGHSRYCYAAMRKATKLQPPHLPDLSMPNDSSSKDADDDEATWRVIKSWSESLLNAQFESADDLASHISQNKLNSASGSTSKQILQKRLMQREMKERRRNNVSDGEKSTIKASDIALCTLLKLTNQFQNQTLKKRRKKRRKSTESPDTNQGNDDMFDEHIQIKQEKETDGSTAENNYSEDSSDVPMNLTSSEQSRRIQSEMNLSTNHAAVTSQFDNEINDTIKNKLKQKIALSMPEQNEFNNDDNQYVLCKKVRQAQQLKMTANASMMSNQFQDGSMAAPPVTSAEVVHEMLMPSKIPAKRKQKREAIAQAKKSRYLDKLDDQANTLPLNQVEPNDLVVKKDDLKEDFILPRERFISICNMDRNALDTYLNANEENSQDLELLQYFGEDKNKTVDCDEEDLGPASTSVPLLENYQLFNEGKSNEKTSDKISQLRSMLEEKYNATGVTNNVNNNNNNNNNCESVIKNLLQKNCHQPSSDMNNCEMNAYNSASSSFNNNNMSQRPHHNLPQLGRNFSNESSVNGSDKFIPQSPNTRRKNFSFVPIPTQSTRAKNINLHPAFKGDMATSPFVSPRATPVNKRVNPLLNIRNPNMSIETKSIPVLGVNNTAFCRPHQFKMEPASAPQSPSMIQNYNYSPQAQQNQQNQFQFQPLNNQGTNYNYPVESRSQSVPPHCTNTNMFNSYTSYSSACSSMAPTPVPSDYQEFSDSNILDIFNNEQSQPSSTIKMEATDDVIDLLDKEIMNQNSDENQSIRQTFANSRSVPNTPLPYHVNYGNMNSFCPVGKSVPTTPIGTNGGNPFRYSPELQRTRDFLINGFNNNNNNNVINNNTNKISKDDEGSLSNDIDELSNLDTSLLNNL